MALEDRDYMREAPVEKQWGGLTAFHAIIALNIAVYILQHGLGVFATAINGQLIPEGGVSVQALGRGQFWTAFTHMFVHGHFFHLAFNLLLLWPGGRGVQQLFGGLHLVLIYVFSGLLGAAAELTVHGVVSHDIYSILIGASASAFGLLTALAVATPAEEVTALVTFVIPVRLRLWTLVKILCALQLVLGVASLVPGLMPAEMRIAYFAHLGGAAAGWFYARSLGYGGRPQSFGSHWQPELTRSGRQPEMARARRRMAASSKEDEAGELLQQPPTSADPVASIIEGVVNPLLDKINLHGEASLTEEERLRLKNASDEVKRHRQR